MVRKWISAPGLEHDVLTRSGGLAENAIAPTWAVGAARTFLTNTRVDKEYRFNAGLGYVYEGNTIVRGGGRLGWWANRIAGLAVSTNAEVVTWDYAGIRFLSSAGASLSLLPVCYPNPYGNGLAHGQGFNIAVAYYPRQADNRTCQAPELAHTDRELSVLAACVGDGPWGGRGADAAYKWYEVLGVNKASTIGTDQQRQAGRILLSVLRSSGIRPVTSGVGAHGGQQWVKLSDGSLLSRWIKDYNNASRLGGLPFMRGEVMLHPYLGSGTPFGEYGAPLVVRPGATGQPWVRAGELDPNLFKEGVEGGDEGEGEWEPERIITLSSRVAQILTERPNVLRHLDMDV